ncbi:hypothetical protein MLD52_05130 [Puniceicoccaceae bacterium K14]|nr:hypothetical protein [Puniceicoccaceae bacterium K14]
MPKKRGKITLSQLIQAKRAEKPDDHFWENFSRELDVKMRLEAQASASKLTLSSRDFWLGFRKVTGACGLALTCGAFTVLTVSSFQVASTGPAHEEAFALLPANSKEFSEPQVTFAPAITTDQKTPLFIVDEPTMTLTSDAPEAETLVVTTDTRQSSTPHFDAQDFVMELPNALELEKVDAFASFDLSGDNITERYIDTLKGLGYTSNTNSSQNKQRSARFNSEFNDYNIEMQSRSSNHRSLDSITLIRF